MKWPGDLQPQSMCGKILPCICFAKKDESTFKIFSQTVFLILQLKKYKSLQEAGSTVSSKHTLTGVLSLKRSNILLCTCSRLWSGDTLMVLGCEKHHILCSYIHCHCKKSGEEYTTGAHRNHGMAMLPIIMCCWCSYPLLPKDCSSFPGKVSKTLATQK